ncbi:MAG: T9SS type A sorting domain-containing protein, partial [Ignavibacteriaceae bacterium]|nr:T9SS type A sorting domain-containing protein [Ignavibacteriaceae bacterium]
TITITGVGLAWNNNGIFSYGTSKVKMNGGAPQSMFGSTFYDLEIDNTSGVTLTSSDVVTHQLILTHGTLTLGNFNMTVSGSIVGGGSSNYIITNGSGTVIQNVGPLTGVVLFPIGTASSSDYTPISFSNTNDVRLYYVRVEPVTPDPGGLAIHWIVKEEAGKPNYTVFGSMALVWTSTSHGNLSSGSCQVVANLTGTAPYNPIYSSGGVVSGALVPSTFTPGPLDGPILDITGGLYITIVQTNVGLPVELSSFTSSANGRNISLNWETKTEKNSNKFVIERANIDANSSSLNWESISSVKAAVLSNSPKQYSFTDKNLQTGKYQYRLKMIDNDGSFAYSKVENVEVSVPKNFELSQNYPNPFNPNTKINYSLPNDSKVTLEVYNIIGERVAQLVNEQQPAGYYTINFSISNNKITSGIYIYKLSADDNNGKSFSSIKKMILLK